MAPTGLPAPPIAPMLARTADALPQGPGFLFEPKWDGLRALVFRGAGPVYLQSRDLRPLDRRFPELEKALQEALPRGCILDGEIVIATPRGLDFGALQLRLHASAARLARLVQETPASFVAFDLLAAGGRSTMELPQAERRVRLERLLGHARPPLHLSPATRDRAQAEAWLRDFEGAGLDGVVARPESAPYQPGKRALFKVKHLRTADCVVAGFRRDKEHRDAVAALLLALYDEAGTLQPVGLASSFPPPLRQDLLRELEPLRSEAPADADWEPLRPGRVCEVRYDALQGRRFRHAATFLRWRSDKPPQDCRQDQLEVVPAAELTRMFGD